MLEVLLQAGANPSRPTDDGSQPLHVAARSGHLETVQILLASGCELTSMRSGGQTPLWEATILACTDKVPDGADLLPLAPHTHGFSSSVAGEQGEALVGPHDVLVETMIDHVLKPLESAEARATELAGFLPELEKRVSRAERKVQAAQLARRDLDRLRDRLREEVDELAAELHSQDLYEGETNRRGRQRWRSTASLAKR